MQILHFPQIARQQRPSPGARSGPATCVSSFSPVSSTGRPRPRVHSPYNIKLPPAHRDDSYRHLRTNPLSTLNGLWNDRLQIQDPEKTVAPEGSSKRATRRVSDEVHVLRPCGGTGGNQRPPLDPRATVGIPVWTPRFPQG